MPAELTVSKHAAVTAGGEEGGVEVSGEGTLCQSKLLHLAGCLRLCLLQWAGLRAAMSHSQAS